MTYTKSATPSDNLNKIEEICKTLAWTGSYIDSGQQVVDEISVEKATQALYELMLGVIGEDEKPQHQPFSEAIDTESNKIIRNDFRTTQRKKLGI